MATTNKNITALTAILNKLTTAKELEEIALIKKLSLRPRQAKRSCTYGVQVELLVNIARQINNPLTESDKWSEMAELDAIEDLVELLPVAKAERTNTLDLLEGIRESYGYNSFIVEDENGIAESIFDGKEPDAEELEECYVELLKLFKLKDETDFKFDDSKWSKAEAKALVKAQDLMAEAEADKLALEEMVA